MVSPIKPGAKLLQVDGPTIETPRLILRPWRVSDIARNTAMLGDPEVARFITPDRKPVTSEQNGWRNAAIISGHWALHGFGMFAVEEKASGDYVGRVGPWYPPGWPGFEVGWAITPDRWGRGYAVEAARGAIDWVFANFTVDRIVHCIDAANAPSQGVARRLGAVNEGPGQLNDHVVDIWVTARDRWTRDGS
ncbi:GNAT family N-acetyltransferase [Bradyrhizobium jicamae]|uniref:GNAT family N-acetyltransferase n=1 Tax=Bradyrhizobium jicamae TaxID=280332 RepID=UPI001BABC2A1|nr:GNAT family N-acetyltransferase [Bradyrhizobium jicamae]MBR0757167.1 GNAT family N-acetyltransferase [Bradyrhizobium jicamae]